ncbi:heme-degrading domain-containing protein [Clostridium estertheticum]|uniref:heme-degrading domain-containing protein n=1 Tax=Clostridium estertheticum TaxID=238834 RepID=UPI001C0BACBA|nr:heme-degrading domain-containing protein [Clostridium estertheticum]MBU3213526.1 heme-degrading domain-containing protein [Clostridium estertheticum]WAG57840.1 heme-degrading domain-containing protein [Clostridium estertheticum]
MEDYEKMLRDIEKQEEMLQFTEFTSETALKIGIKLIEKARAENLSLTIDITKGGHQIFHYAFEGTTPDNDAWIIRKNRVVNRFWTSSLYIGTKLKITDKAIDEKYFISDKEYSAHGGAFPIIIKNVGVVGTITSSGAEQMVEHNLIVEVLKEFLKK